jgi:FkbM family methyltransferase
MVKQVEKMKRALLNLVGLTARYLPMSVKLALYRSPRLATVIRGSLNRVVPQGLTTVTVTGGGLKGVRLALDLQEEKDYWLGTYEPDLQAVIANLAKSGDVVYDVGANIGYISLLLARAVGEAGKVFAFEALPDNQVRLHQNIALNEMHLRVVVVRVAVVESSHPVRFLLGPSGGMGKAEGSAGRQELSYSQSVLVPGTSLDEFVYKAGRPVPQLVKMDIEGGEVLAMPGMKRLLCEARPILLLELHGPEAARVVWDTLMDARYRLYHMEQGYLSVASLEDLDWKSYTIGLPLS